MRGKKMRWMLLVVSLLWTGGMRAGEVARYTFDGRLPEGRESMTRLEIDGPVVETDGLFHGPAYVPIGAAGESGPKLANPLQSAEKPGSFYEKDGEREVLAIRKIGQSRDKEGGFHTEDLEGAAPSRALTIEVVFSLESCRGVTTGGMRNFSRLLSTGDIQVIFIDFDEGSGSFSLLVAAAGVATRIDGLKSKTYMHLALTADTDGTLLAYIDGVQRAETMMKPGWLRTSLALAGGFPGEVAHVGMVNMKVDEIVVHATVLPTTEFVALKGLNAQRVD